MKERQTAQSRKPENRTALDAIDLRVTSYNIHACRNSAPDRIAGIIDAIGADVVALQEVDAEKPFELNHHQARTIGELLGFDYCFFPLEKSGLRVFGLAVLSRYPIVQSESTRLPNLYPRLNPRKRGVLRAAVYTPIGIITLINTHLSLYSLERESQINRLLSWNGLSAIPVPEPIILCGDLNAGPYSSTYLKVARHLRDVQKATSPRKPPKPTFHSRSPILRIDHIFVSDHFSPMSVEVVRNPQTMIASDHLPLVADLKFYLF